MYRLLLLIIAISILLCPVMAKDTVQQQFDVVGGSALVDALPDGIDVVTDTNSFWNSAHEMITNAFAKNQHILRAPLKASATILCIILLCSAAGTVAEGVSKRAIVFAGIAAILGSTTVDTKDLVASGTHAMDELYAFTTMLLPVIAGACAASGSVTASAALSSGTLLFMHILISAVKKLLVPLVYASMALAAADAALGDAHLRRVRSFLTSTVKNTLRVMMLLFGAFMSLTGVFSGSADALALKATKMAISTMVPIVGGMVSDATETVLVGAKTVLHSVGITGMLAVLSIILVPFLQLGLRYIVLQVTAALCSVFGLKEHSAVLDAVTSAVGYLTGMTICCAVMAFVACICFMKVSVT